VGDRAGPVERVEIEVFVVEDGTTAPAREHVSLADRARHGYEVLREHAGEVQAARCYRPVPTIAGARCRGECDIVRSMRVDPWTASTIACSEAFRCDDHRYLTFLDAEPDDDHALTWSVLVASRRLRVPATLHLRADPSMVLSVLELVPRRRLRWRRDAFVAAGVEAVDSLAHEFEHDVRVVSGTPRTPYRGTHG
jgi:hypothetical protein